MKGKCKWFNVKKGYGFITGEDKIDYFVHHSSIKMEGYRKLVDGQLVEFEPSKNEKGSHAVEVLPLEYLKGGAKWEPKATASNAKRNNR